MANLAAIQNSVLSTEQIEVLTGAGLIPKNTPPAQVAVYAKICTDKGLNPFTKEIYLVKTSSEKYGDIYTPMVGIDGWRKKIHEMGDYIGTETKFNLTGKGEWKTMFEVEAEIIKWYNKEIPQRFDKTKTEIGKTVHQILMSGVYPLTCTVEVYRSLNGVKTAFSKTVSYREFAGISNWEKMPLQMIEKVAKAFSYKEALGEWASGLHLEEEKAAFEGSQAATVITEPEPKTDFTPEEKKAFSRAIQSASTRELALKALENMDIAHENAGFEFAADQRAMFVAFIDKKYPKPIEITETADVFVGGGKYEPTEFDLEGLSACKNVGQFNMLADSIGRNLIETYGNDAFILESFAAWADNQRKNFK